MNANTNDDGIKRVVVSAFIREFLVFIRDLQFSPRPRHLFERTD